MELSIGNQTLFFTSPIVMGIINITPDSFYPKSRHTTFIEVFTSIERMIEEGAAIIDLGAVSSRPGARSLSASLEWERLSPTLSELRKHFPNTIISVETSCRSIIEQVFDLIGPFIINDISAGEDDPSMFSVAARLQLPLIAMHKKGTSQSMNQYAQYQNVVKEVYRFFSEKLSLAKEEGVGQIIIDPGFGFAKTTEHNYQLLANLSSLINFPNVPSMIGISRKSMIYKPLAISVEETLPPTTALHLFALQQGVNILRVHDVSQATQVIKLFTLLSNSLL